MYCESMNEPAFEAVLEVVEEGLLHHIRDLVALERGADQDDGPHGRHDVVRRDGFRLLEKGLPLLLGTRTATASRKAALVQLRVPQRI